MNWALTWSDEVYCFHCWERFSFFVDVFNNCIHIQKAIFCYRRFQASTAVQYWISLMLNDWTSHRKLYTPYNDLVNTTIWSHLLVMPSAEISCILQQADTILIASWSTTNTRHSTPCPGFFLFLIASFIISIWKKHRCYWRRKHAEYQSFSSIYSSSLQCLISSSVVWSV